eukprot:gnl/Dysnectes_brevis/3047_a3774_750.p1 GENE.gnl/Dysnectes_brevis/3047_a3774_750~~gnl/Dysnectes_brevis/3047_a3774_750.p1  ORF type:complete len:201 (-),score=33.41 gnl/Dysnectes_brevis/3047_a3774_750:58-660(-)
MGSVVSSVVSFLKAVLETIQDLLAGFVFSETVIIVGGACLFFLLYLTTLQYRALVRTSRPHKLLRRPLPTLPLTGRRGRRAARLRESIRLAIVAPPASALSPLSAPLSELLCPALRAQSLLLSASPDAARVQVLSWRDLVLHWHRRAFGRSPPDPNAGGRYTDLYDAARFAESPLTERRAMSALSEGQRVRREDPGRVAR